MQDQHPASAGFIITISSCTGSEPPEGEMTLDLNQVGEQVTRFIASQLRPGMQLSVNFRIEHWDEVFSNEQSVFTVRQEPPAGSNQDYTRNYWI